VARRPVSCRIAARVSRSELVGATNDDGVVINISPVFFILSSAHILSFYLQIGNENRSLELFFIVYTSQSKHINIMAGMQ